MTTVIIPLDELVLTPGSTTDLSGMSDEELMRLLRDSYGFLGPAARFTVNQGALQITLPDASGYQRDQALRNHQRAVKSGNRASYDRALRLLREVVDIVPEHTAARRDLAMAYLESGDPETARQLLIETLRLNPKDAWAYVLLGNIAGSVDNDLDLAARLFERALELSPRDVVATTNYAGILGRQGRLQEAHDQFLRAIEIKPNYPQPYYGLANLAHREGNSQQAVARLENMFDIAKGVTARDQTFFTEARRLYLEANIRVAGDVFDELMGLVRDRAKEIEELTGYRVDLVRETEMDVPATTQVGWAYGRDYHLLRYRGEDNVSTPHLLMHELEHIAMQFEAMQAGKNRTFVSTATTDRAAELAIEEHARTMRRKGTSEAFIQDWLPRTTRIVRSQLYNIPLDMVIEHRLYERYEELHPSQFASLFRQQADARRTIEDASLQERVPPIVYKATISLNHAFALFIDGLYGERTEYAAPYKRVIAAADGPKIYSLWQRMMRDFATGDEYRLVDEVAKLLGLDRWFEWRTEVAVEGAYAVDSEPARPSGVTDKDALLQRLPAVVSYCVDALERFEGWDDAAIFRVASETALVGKQGLDYTDPERKYRLTSFPDEKFSGLHIMSLMYVAFKLVNPALDLGLPFAEAYEQARSLYQAKRGE